MTAVRRGTARRLGLRRPPGYGRGGPLPAGYQLVDYTPLNTPLSAVELAALNRRLRRPLPMAETRTSFGALREFADGQQFVWVGPPPRDPVPQMAARRWGWPA